VGKVSLKLVHKKIWMKSENLRRKGGLLSKKSATIGMCLYNKPAPISVMLLDHQYTSVMSLEYHCPANSALTKPPHLVQYRFPCPLRCTSVFDYH
jgi:hypothetical protein